MHFVFQKFENNDTIECTLSQRKIIWACCFPYNLGKIKFLVTCF